MSSSEASSSDSESLSGVQVEKSKKSRAQPTVIRTPHGKNEGVDPDWAYKPPPGATLAEAAVDDEFDWDKLAADEDTELWIMRVPESIKPKHLDNLKLDAPSDTASKSARIGSLERKSITYDVWSLGADADDVVGAEEVKGLSLVTPRQKKKGKLFLGPKINTRHIVVTARPPSPSRDMTDDPAADMSWHTQQNPPRPSYPKEILKHRFVPFGSITSNATAETTDDSMEVDVPSPAKRSKKDKGKKDVEVKSKKRKTNDTVDSGARQLPS